jgi:hypothetical protein
MRFDWTEYIVITAADLTAVGVAAFLAWLARKWIEKKATQVLSKINWQHGHLYWLASDLTWTEMQVKDGNIPKLLHGLKQFVHHASALGLGDPILSRLNELYRANAGKDRLGEAEKGQLINTLDEIITSAGKLAEQTQSDFKPDPNT